MHNHNAHISRNALVRRLLLTHFAEKLDRGRAVAVETGEAGSPNTFPQSPQEASLPCPPRTCEHPARMYSSRRSAQEAARGGACRRQLEEGARIVHRISSGFGVRAYSFSRREGVPSRPGRRSRCRTARLPPTARRIMRSVNDGVVRTTRPPPIARRIVRSVNDGRPPPTAPGESCAPPNRRNKLRQWRLRAPPLPACTISSAPARPGTTPADTVRTRGGINCENARADAGRRERYAHRKPPSHAVVRRGARARREARTASISSLLLSYTLFQIHS